MTKNKRPAWLNKYKELEHLFDRSLLFVESGLRIPVITYLAYMDVQKTKPKEIIKYLKSIPVDNTPFKGFEELGKDEISWKGVPYNPNDPVKDIDDLVKEIKKNR